MSRAPVPLDVVSTTVSQGPEDLARSRRRGAAVLGVVAVLLALAVVFTATAQSEPQGSITFIQQGSGPGSPPIAPVVLQAADFGTPDVVDKTYEVLDFDGNKRPVRVQQGWSLQHLLTQADVDLGPYPFLTVERPQNGTKARLRKGQVTNSRAFPDGPIVVYVDDQGSLAFLRPQGDVEGDDHNGDDAFPFTGTLNVRLRKKAPLDIQIRVTPKHPKVGQVVKFDATATGQAGGDQLTYQWFNNEASFNLNGASVKHRFTKKGSFPILLTVSSSFGSNDDENRSVTVDVEPTKSKKNRKGGGTNEDDDAPDSGTSTGTGTGTGTGSTGGYTAPYSGYDAGTSAPITPSPVTPAVTTPPAETTPTPTPPPTPTTPKETVPATSGETEVQGTVLTGLSLAAANVPPAAAANPPDAAADDVAARTGTPKKLPDPTGGLHVPAGVWILLLLVLLLIGGFWQDAYRAVAPRSVPRIP